MGEKPWCFDIGTDTLGTLPDVKEAYLAELEAIHEEVTPEVWKDTVEDMNLSDNGLEQFEDKPDSAVTGKWWELKSPVDPWKKQREYVLNFDISAEIKDLKEIVNATQQKIDSFRSTIGPDESDSIDEDLYQAWLSSKQIIDDIENKTYNQAHVESQYIGAASALNNSLPIDVLAYEDIGGFSTTIEKIGIKLTSLRCDTNFKDEYSQALLKLAGPEIEEIDSTTTEITTSAQRRALQEAGINPDDFESGLRDGIKKKIQENLARLEEKIDIATAGAAEAIIFKEQCFLLGNLGFLVDQKKKMPVPLPLPYVATLGETETEERTEDIPGRDGEPILESVQTERNQPLHVQGEAFSFINKLAVDPSQAALFDLKPHEISSLTPHMLFYKVISDENGKDVEIPITFDTSVTSTSLAQYKKGGRGIGVGVKSFTFSYDGSDPFSAKKAISAKLSIYATSFSDLLRERGKGDKKYKYVDLALKTGTSKENSDPSTDELTKAQKENLEKLNFRLKAVVQWTATKSNLKLIDERVKDAVYNSAVSIYLLPTIHEFDFDETGAVTFDINYQAYVEHYFADPQFDIFASATNDKIARKLVYDYFREQNCDTSTGSEFSDFRQQDEAFVSSVNTSSLSSIISELRRREKIYYFKISKEDMMQWLRFPSSTNVVRGIKPSPPVSEDIVNQAQEAATNAGDDKAKQTSAMQLSLIANSDAMSGVTFFYLSDLVSIVLDNIETSLENSDTIDSSRFFQDVVDNLNKSGEIKKYVEGRTKKEKIPKLKASHEQFKKLRIVLGPMEIYPYNTSKTAEPAISCTLGDIPISLNYFLDFMAQKVLAKQITQYPLSKFIKDVINDTIRNFLNSDDCFKTNSSQKTSLNSTTILGYNTKQGTAAKDDISALILQEMAKGKEGAAVKNCLLASKVKTDLPMIKISGPRNQPRPELSIDKMINYYVFSAGRRYPDAAYTGNKTSDSSRGVFHYLLGEDKGIVKNIRLDKTSAPGLKEVRFEQEGYEGLTQLREVYNANIETFLNPQTFPGTYIYVEPKGFDPTATEDLTRFGIGGYYMIIKSTHTISPGNAETQLNAAWVASKGDKSGRATTEGEGEARDPEREENGDESIKKCQVHSLSSTKGNR